MNLAKLKKYLKNEEEKTFKGWDFSYIDGKCFSEELPWDYKKTLQNYLKPSDRLLDMGTGGGEFLLTIEHPHNLMSVTEAYPPNVQVCYDRLLPLGIEVKQVFEDAKLPFANSTFDIVINRHESFDISEVNRILKSGGYFITQQVGSRNNNDLSQKLIDNFVTDITEHDLKHNRELIINRGFEILFEDEVFNKMKFYDLGALVYFAKIIEWEFPNFSVDSCFNNLCKVQNELIENGYISGIEHRFILVAKKL